jgi:hypothetical protein
MPQGWHSQEEDHAFARKEEAQEDAQEEASQDA